MLVGVNVAWFSALAVTHVAFGPGELVNGETVALALLYVLIVIVALFCASAASNAVTCVFGFASAVIYGQSLLFSRLLPGIGHYSRSVTLGSDDMNAALKLLLGFTVAAVAGFRAGEILTPKCRMWRMEEWFVHEANRRLFYKVAMLGNLVYAALAFVLIPQTGRMWSDRLVVKMLLHLVVFNGVYVYPTIVILLHPKLKRSARELSMIGGVLFTYFLGGFITGEKGAFMHMLLIAFVCRLLFGVKELSQRLAMVYVGAAVLLLFMFAVTPAVKGAMRASGLGLEAAEEKFSEVFAIDYEGGLVAQVLNLSLRFGGMEWFAAILVKADTFKEYFTVPMLFESLVNTFVPWPGKVFPELVDVGTAMQVAMWGLSYEDTKLIGGYPMLPGWMYVTFGGVGGAVVMCVWGAVAVMVVRSDVGLIKKLMFVYLFVWSFFLSGDLVPYVKGYAVSIVMLWMITRLGVQRRIRTGDEMAAGRVRARGCVPLVSGE